MKENKIVDLSGKPVTGDAANRTSKALGEDLDSQAPSGPAPRPVSLTFGEANRLGGAYARLRELAQKKVITANDEAEKAGLQTYIKQEVEKWGPELLGTWFVVHTEYQPLLRAINGIVDRIAGARAGNPVPVETSHATDHSE